MGDYNDATMHNKDAAVQARTKAQNRASIVQLKLAEKRARIHKIRLETGAIKAAEELLKYDPSNDPNISRDPYKTLFVAKLNYETMEHRIKREFEAYGPIQVGRSPGKEEGIETESTKSPVNAPMTRCMIVIQEKIGTTETMTGVETGRW